MTYAENIIAVYNRATEQQRDEGMSWYRDAHNLAMTLSPDDIWRGAGVISAYSPMTPWHRNVELAKHALTTGDVPDNFLPAMVNAVKRILNGEHPLNVLGGDKTRSFAEAIATGGMGNIATIDRHAHDIAAGRVYADSERKIGKVLYRRMAAHYFEAAREAGISVNQIQAVTWLVWRSEKGIK